MNTTPRLSGIDQARPDPGDWGRGSWMQTFTGRRFYPLAAEPGDIDPIDIAHALGLQCRYNGHVDRFYCPTPDQRVLTADLRWIPAGDLRVGDELLGFDEIPGNLGGGIRRRKFRHSSVLTALPVKRRVVRLVMKDGSSVTASEEHPWLVATKQSRNQAWVTVGDIREALRAGRKRYMHRFAVPWEPDTSFTTGWLSGILDGEGHLSFIGRSGVQFGVAQRPGLVLDEIVQQMERLGFRWSTTAVGASDVQSLQVYGGWREMMRLLGTVRPIRLMDKFKVGLRTGVFDKRMDGVAAPLEIIAAYDEGEQWVAGLETTTRTYLCEGFGAHNSVAEHCVLMSQAVAPEHALWALLHDATEAYVGGMVRPLKNHMPEYREVEDRLMGVIATRFGLVGPMPDEVKAADSRILLTERQSLMRATQHAWDVEGLDPLPVAVTGWAPQEAEEQYLARLHELWSDCPSRGPHT